jgi:DNA recombination-mediator protein A/DprA winged helix domain
VAYRLSWFVGPQCPMVPRPQGNAALSAAVVVVEAAEDSGSLSTARAAGSRGVGHVLVLPGAPWDPGAAGCNQLIRDGATLVRSLTDILEELGATVGSDGTSTSPAWPGLDPPARAVLTALIDGQLLSPGRLAAATDLPPAALDAALLDLELAGLVRRTTAGIQAIGLPRPRVASPTRSTRPTRSGPPSRPAPVTLPADVAGGRPRSRDGAAADGSPPEGAAAERRPVSSPGPRGPPRAGPSAEVLECGGSGGDDGRDD